MKEWDSWRFVTCSTYRLPHEIKLSNSDILAMVCQQNKSEISKETGWVWMEYFAGIADFIQDVLILKNILPLSQVPLNVYFQNTKQLGIYIFTNII